MDKAEEFQYNVLWSALCNPPTPPKHQSPKVQCDIWWWGLWEMIRFRCRHEGEDFMMGLVLL